mgnify:CR=1 FL=1
MTDKEKPPKPVEEKQLLRRRIARALWDVQMIGVDFPDATARKSKFDEDKTVWLKQAALLIGRLEKNGIMMTVPTKSDPIE